MAQEAERMTNVHCLTCSRAGKRAAATLCGVCVGEKIRAGGARGGRTLTLCQQRTPHYCVVCTGTLHNLHLLGLDNILTKGLKFV
ncbi:hypothetical protein J6590_072222 [Homalodisca vitripennis]|nr:hypothetical protein J6590_072222 [Homalodisca vitripennis]